MLIRKPDVIRSSEITPKSIWTDRRAFLATAGAAALGSTRLLGAQAGAKIDTVKSRLSTPGLTPTAKNDATHYNNFYEFGTDKTDPARNAGSLQTSPWAVKVEGLVEKPKTVSLDDLAHFRPQEERVYRMRCVEAWSMVIPWAGYSLSQFIDWCRPLPSAKYVQFLSLYDPRQMPEAGGSGIDWPYTEGLRMDEAMHPLTLLTFGMYGEPLPKQDGAPVRIVVPWKYGYKSIKSITTIRFVDKEPPTTWNRLAPNEYGFYSNVNPEVDHPRWSQRSERVIGAPVWKPRQPTLMFNGYADQVAGLYKGMDLRKNS